MMCISSSTHVLIIGIGATTSDVLLIYIKQQLSVDPCSDSDPDACSSSDEEGGEEQEEGVYTCPEEEESGLSFHLPQLPPVDSPLQFCWDFAKMSLPPEVVAAISPEVII